MTRQESPFNDSPSTSFLQKRHPQPHADPLCQVFLDPDRDGRGCAAVPASCQHRPEFWPRLVTHISGRAVQLVQAGPVGARSGGLSGDGDEHVAGDLEVAEVLIELFEDVENHSGLRFREREAGVL